jgi:cytochrome c-type biogenesis protein
VTVAAGLFVAGFTVVFVAATASVFGLIGALAVSRVLLQRIGASSRSSWGWRSWG